MYLRENNFFVCSIDLIPLKTINKNIKRFLFDTTPCSVPEFGLYHCFQMILTEGPLIVFLFARVVQRFLNVLMWIFSGRRYADSYPVSIYQFSQKRGSRFTGGNNPANRSCKQDEEPRRLFWSYPGSQQVSRRWFILKYLLVPHAFLKQ